MDKTLQHVTANSAAYGVHLIYNFTWKALDCHFNGEHDKGERCEDMSATIRKALDDPKTTEAEMQEIFTLAAQL